LKRCCFLLVALAWPPFRVQQNAAPLKLVRRGRLWQ